MYVSFFKINFESCSVSGACRGVMWGDVSWQLLLSVLAQIWWDNLDCDQYKTGHTRSPVNIELNIQPAATSGGWSSPGVHLVPRYQDIVLIFTARAASTLMIISWACREGKKIRNGRNTEHTSDKYHNTQHNLHCQTNLTFCCCCGSCGSCCCCCCFYLGIIVSYPSQSGL